jgi:hypothetical protein
VLRLTIVPALIALALGFAGTAAAQGTQLFPGVTYEGGVQFTPHGPVAIHVVRGPRPSGLYRLRPVLSNESITRLESVTSMQRRLSSQATAVGINGDYYSFRDGRPSGILMHDGVLVSPPNGGRSSTGITLDGLLDVRRVKMFGTWRGAGQGRAVNAFNEAPEANGIALFTSDWGSVTPRTPGARNVVLSPFPAATPNADLVATVASSVQSASIAIAPGTAVLVARGTAAAKLTAEAPLGTTVTVRLILQPDWVTVGDAIGGGPAIVRDGAPIFHANEGFTTAQLAPRHPRTAVGQAADGRVLLVAVDGRQSGYSVGMTNFELAQTMLRLGAVRAMALDGGGSTTLAFDGTVLNRPSEGRERPVSTALMLLYSGVYAPPPEATVLSPNGDGVGEEQTLSYKLVRPSTTTVTLTAPDGSPAFQEATLQEAGTYEVPFPPPPLPPQPPPEGVPPLPPAPQLPPAEGRWTLTITSTDDQGLASSATRRFWVNSTLGYLRVAPRTLFLPPKGRNMTIHWTQVRAARVTVQVETMDGVLLKTVVRRPYEPGQIAVVWNGRRRDGRLAYGGRYLVRVVARNELGSVSLEQQLTVRRIAGAKGK